MELTTLPGTGMLLCEWVLQWKREVTITNGATVTFGAGNSPLTASNVIATYFIIIIKTLTNGSN
jgi:hypothetical protein